MATGRARTFAVAHGKSIVEMLWEDLVALCQDPDMGKRKAGKAEGIAFALCRIIKPLEPVPARTLDIVRDCLTNYLEALEAGEDPSGHVPWRDRRLIEAMPPAVAAASEARKQAKIEKG